MKVLLTFLKSVLFITLIIGKYVKAGEVLIEDGSNTNTASKRNLALTGSSWNQVSVSASWPPRYGHVSLALDSSTIVVLGGYSLGGKVIYYVNLSL